jgi:hypothetical protein
VWAVPEHRLRVPLQLPKVEIYLSSSAAAGAFCNEQRVATEVVSMVERAGPEAAAAEGCLGAPIGPARRAAASAGGCARSAVSSLG